MIVEREIKEQLLSILIFNCLQLVCLYARIQDASVLIITDLYLSASTISYNSSVNTIKYNKETATNI